MSLGQFVRTPFSISGLCLLSRCLAECSSRGPQPLAHQFRQNSNRSSSAFLLSFGAPSQNRSEFFSALLRVTTAWSFVDLSGKRNLPNQCCDVICGNRGQCLRGKAVLERMIIETLQIAESERKSTRFDFATSHGKRGQWHTMSVARSIRDLPQARCSSFLMVICALFVRPAIPLKTPPGEV